MTECILDRIFERLLIASRTKPFNLPVFKAFPAPVDEAKFNEFFASLQANGWNVDVALAPYKEDEQIGVVAFYDAMLGEYKFCSTLRFWRLNGIHVHFDVEYMQCIKHHADE